MKEQIINGIKYRLNEETLTAAVTYLLEGDSIEDYVGDIKIPETVEFNGVPYLVTSIEDSAFSDCESLTSITIPDSVTSIGRSAFDNCDSLEKKPTQEIEINEKEEVETKAGEFITFAVVTDDKKLKKGEINANRFRENKVETEFSSIVQLNVMTKEIVDSLTLEPSKHKYEAKDGEILDATEDVKYKGVRFKKDQLNKLIENGAKVEILDNNNIY